MTQYRLLSYRKWLSIGYWVRYLNMWNFVANNSEQGIYVSSANRYHHRTGGNVPWWSGCTPAEFLPYDSVFNTESLQIAQYRILSHKRYWVIILQYQHIAHSRIWPGVKLLCLGLQYSTKVQCQLKWIFGFQDWDLQSKSNVIFPLKFCSHRSTAGAGVLPGKLQKDDNDHR